MSLDDAIKRMYRAYESDYQQMMFMSDIREAAQREVQPRVSAADWSEVDGIRTRVEADVRSRKLTGYNLVSEVMVYGQTMSLLAAGEPIPQTAV